MQNFLNATNFTNTAENYNCSDMSVLPQLSTPQLVEIQQAGVHYFNPTPHYHYTGSTFDDEEKYDLEYSTPTISQFNTTFFQLPPKSTKVSKNVTHYTGSNGKLDRNFSIPQVELDDSCMSFYTTKTTTKKKASGNTSDVAEYNDAIRGKTPNPDKFGVYHYTGSHKNTFTMDDLLEEDEEKDYDDDYPSEPEEEERKQPDTKKKPNAEPMDDDGFTMVDGLIKGIPKYDTQPKQFGDIPPIMNVQQMILSMVNNTGLTPDLLPSGPSCAAYESRLMNTFAYKCLDYNSVFVPVVGANADKVKIAKLIVSLVPFSDVEYAALQNSGVTLFLDARIKLDTSLDQAFKVIFGLCAVCQNKSIHMKYITIGANDVASITGDSISLGLFMCLSGYPPGPVITGAIKPDGTIGAIGDIRFKLAALKSYTMIVPAANFSDDFSDPAQLLAANMGVRGPVKLFLVKTIAEALLSRPLNDMSREIMEYYQVAEGQFLRCQSFYYQNNKLVVDDFLLFKKRLKKFLLLVDETQEKFQKAQEKFKADQKGVAINGAFYDKLNGLDTHKLKTPDGVEYEFIYQSDNSFLPGPWTRLQVGAAMRNISSMDEFPMKKGVSTVYNKDDYFTYDNFKTWVPGLSGPVIDPETGKIKVGEETMKAKEFNKGKTIIMKTTKRGRVVYQAVPAKLVRILTTTTQKPAGIKKKTAAFTKPTNKVDATVFDFTGLL